MRKLITTVAALAVLTFAGSAHANDGNIDMGWTTCAPTTTNLASIAPGTASVAIFVSVIGLDQPHKSYEFQIIYGRRLDPSTLAVPDAWAFDSPGCQGAAGIAIDHLSGSSKACPALMGTISPNFQLKTAARDGVGGYDVNLMHISVANAYPNGGAGNTTEINPAVRYFLGRIMFDHTASVNGPSDPVTCGGLENPMCFALTSGNYVNVADQQVMFGLAGNRSLTVGTSVGCPATPAVNSTWGQIKSQYRM